jgi:hypothetical protein
MTEFFGVHDLVADMAALVSAYKKNDIDLDVFVRHFSAGIVLIGSRGAGLDTLEVPFSRLSCLANVQVKQGGSLEFDSADESAKDILFIEDVLQQRIQVAAS